MTNIGWAAGFYEGEGSFIEPGYVSITQKDINPLIKIRDIFGGKINLYNGYYYWRLHGLEMRQFILTIFTLLSDRRRKQILKFKNIFTETDKCKNGHEYDLNRKILNNRTGEYNRVCLICARANMRRKNERRRKNNSSPQIEVK